MFPRITPLHAAGSSLLEVLIALILLSLGMLGMISLQVTSLKSNQSAMTRSLATELTHEISDLMRANRTLALSGSYDTEFSTAAPSGSSTHAVDLQNWKSRLAQLPAGQGRIAHNGNQVEITVQWDESRLRQGDSAQQFSYRTEL
jgi:type IV pilus assembly protein PilV